MAQHTKIPSNWTEITYEPDDDYTAVWAHDEEPIRVTVEHDEGDEIERYKIVVVQHVGEDGLETEVRSHAQVADTPTDAERMAAEFMHEVNDGHHVLRLMGVEEWKEFYQFYCISDSEVPDDMRASELIDAIDNEQYNDDIDDLPDDYEPGVDDEHTITVDVFPRHQAEIDTDEHADT